jgi:hypothetical protein
MSGLLFDSFRQQRHRQTARRIEVVTPLGSALNLIRNIFDVVQEISQSSILVVDWDIDRLSMAFDKVAGRIPDIVTLDSHGVRLSECSSRSSARCRG